MMTFTKEAVQKLADGWLGPKSMCTCGHSGDGQFSEHTDVIDGARPGAGHGHCQAPGCACANFSWRRWTLSFGEALNKALQRRRS